MYPPHSGNQYPPNSPTNQPNSAYPPEHGSYPPQHNTGYPPQHNTSYPPQHNAGYPPQHNAGYPPQHNTSYPPQHNTGYPPQHNTGYPPQHNTGYPPQHNTGYPPENNSGYPPQQATGYPPVSGVGFSSSPEIGFSPHNSGYPPHPDASFSRQNSGYPPNAIHSPTTPTFPQNQSGGFVLPQTNTGSFSYNNAPQMNKPPLPNRAASDGHPTGLPPPPPAPPGTRPDFPFRWVYANKGLIPEGAIPLGKESDGATSFVARAYHHKSVQIGRVTPALQGVRIGFAGDFTILKDYYVLCGDPKLTRWVDLSGTLNLNQAPFKPIECGLDIKGDPLYVAAIDYKNGRFLGKVGTHTPGMLYTRNGKERAVPLNETYKILVFA